MIKKICLACFVLTALSCGNGSGAWFDNAIIKSEKQLAYMCDYIKDAPDTLCFPRSVKNGNIVLERPEDWTSGFFPGALWYGYELTGNEKLAEKARLFTERLSRIQYYSGNHDVGFMMFCSYGNGLRLKPEAGDVQVLCNTAKSLSKRYSEKTGLIRSWDFGEWSFPVIIDNMMNLELLFWASEESGDESFKNIAVSHADKTLENHFRKNMTCYHVVSYDAETGIAETKETFQGFADNSAWSRGQAWALYGYTMCYRFTKDEKYLDAAKKVAVFIMENKPSEDDFIPYWDYDAPNIPNEPKDASAAAIQASAFIELSDCVSNGSKYFKFAENILRQLSGKEYLAEPGTNHGYVLKHSVGSFPHDSEIDVPLSYADYYYLEALSRYKEKKRK